MTKICSSCKNCLPLSSFHKDAKKKSGVQSSCKKCVLAKKKIKYQENAEKFRQISAQYRAKNPEKVKAAVAKWRNENVEYRSEYAARYRQENLESCKARDAETYRRNKDKKAAQDKIRRAEKRDLLLQQGAEWRAKNRERRAEQQRAYAAANPGYLREYRYRNPEIVSAQIHRRRARLFRAPGSHTPEEIGALLKAQNYCCANCEVDLRTVRKHLDHWQPLASGGSNDVSNLQWLCITCNVTKSDIDPVEWLRRIGKACHWPPKFKQEPLVVHTARLEIEALCE